MARKSIAQATVQLPEMRQVIEAQAICLTQLPLPNQLHQRKGLELALAKFAREAATCAMASGVETPDFSQTNWRQHWADLAMEAMRQSGIETKIHQMSTQLLRQFPRRIQVSSELVQQTLLAIASYAGQLARLLILELSPEVLGLAPLPTEIVPEGRPAIETPTVKDPRPPTTPKLLQFV